MGQENACQESKVICTNCVLHSKVPGVTINDQGICSECQTTDVGQVDAVVAQFYQKKMEALFARTKQGNHLYDVMVMFSGGKDSVTLLNIIKNQYGLKPLAFAVMHPFVTKVSAKNMEEAAKQIGVDLIKFHIDETLYKDVLRYALLNPEKYDLGESAACRMCYFFINWAGMRMAMQMNIPILVWGGDKSQRSNHYTSGEVIRKRMIQGNLPYGELHRVFEDAIGDRYGKTIYHLDGLNLEEANFPTQLSPLAFMDIEYKDIEKEIQSSGLDTFKYKKVVTTCKAIHLFDYFGFLRYEAPSSIHEWAKGLRKGYPELMQLDTKAGNEVKNLERVTILQIMEEYKQILLYVADQEITESTLESIKRKVFELSPTIREAYSEDAYDLLLENVLTLNDFAAYMGLNLKEYK